MAIQMNPPDGKRDRMKRVKDDFEIIAPNASVLYTALSAPQRQAARDAIINWNDAPANLTELWAKVQALAAIVGLLFVAVAWLIHMAQAK